jgi:uncharacterized protein (TIRG00374 family)
VSLLLAALLVGFFLSRVDLRAIGTSISTASPGWLAGSVVLGLMTFVMRAVRWIWLLRPVGRVPFLPSFTATAVGFAANMVLPARLGEVVRPALLSRQRKLPFTACLASVVFERILDMGSVIFFLVLAVWEGPPAGSAAPRPFRVLIPTAVTAGAALLLLSILAFLIVFRRAAAERLAATLIRLLPVRLREKAAGLVGAFFDGFESLRSGRLFALVVLSSLAMWLVINLQIYCVLRALHLPLPLSAAYVTVAAAVIGLAVPTPGGIGGYHFAVQSALTGFYGVPVAAASAVAVLAHASSFVPITLLGFALFAMTGVRREGIKEIVKAPVPQDSKLGTRDS